MNSCQLGAPTLIVIDGASLTCADVAAAGRRQANVSIHRIGWERASAAAQVAKDAAERRDSYGRTTGVGANRALPISADDVQAHGLRLIRSHATGGGPPLAAEIGIAMLAVRANQISAGGSGVHPGVLGVLAECVNRGLHPPVRIYGAIGTGDLAALAVTALCLLGERDWLPPQDDQPRFALDGTDALAFLSSNAATLAEAAIACHDLATLLEAATVVAALSYLAVSGSVEPLAGPVQLARPHAGQRRVAELLRGLLAGEPGGAARIQDPYGYRALPQVHGAALDAHGQAERAVSIELNAAAENPLIDVPGQTIWHNGNFHAGNIALVLDAARAALYQTAALSAARLSSLMDPRLTGLTAFLAAKPSPSSGALILEYVTHSTLADIRRMTAPAAVGGAVLSLGAEEHAGFATQSAWSTTSAVNAYRVVLGCELTAAVRALRLRGVGPAGGQLASAFDLASTALSGDMADRSLDADLAAAEQLLAPLARLVSAH
jgi:histidine ammonia-lyase